MTEIFDAIDELSKCARKIHREILKNATPPPAPSAILDRIKQMTADALKVPIEAMTSRDRRHEYVVARQVAMWLAREQTNLGLQEIAKAFGKGNQGTVSYALKMIRNARADPINVLFTQDLDNLARRLNEPPPASDSTTNEGKESQ